MSTRRVFLKCVASALITSLSGLSVGCGDPSITERSPEGERGSESMAPQAYDADMLNELIDQLPYTTFDIQELIDSFFEGADRQDLIAIGSAFMKFDLQQSPEMFAESLVMALEESLSSPTIDLATDQLNTQRVNDFTDYHLIGVQGWWLARTEVYLCAISYILNEIQT